MIKGIKMANQSKLELSIIMSFLMLPLQAFASSDTNNLTKDDWLGKLKSIAPTVICKGFFEEESLKKRLNDLKIDNDKCMSLIPASFDKCQTQYYSAIPASINHDNAAKWGHTIGECIGTDFATKYLLGDTSPSTGTSSTNSNPTPSSSGSVTNPNSTNSTTSTSSPSSDSSSPSTTNPSSTSTSPTSSQTSTSNTSTTDTTSTNTSTSSATTFPRDKWLQELKILAPEMICRSFFDDASLKKKFEDKSIDKTKCVSLIPASFDKCQTQYYASLPTTLDSSSATTWGNKIGTCIGADFATKYLTTP